MDHSYFDEPSLAQRPWTLAHRPSGPCRGPAGTNAGDRLHPSIHPATGTSHIDPMASLDAAGPPAAPAAASTEALALEHIRHRYAGMTAVDDVSLSIAQGEILCLVGPSGCGKSTLLRIAAGLEALQRGTVRINGKVVADDTGCMPPERRGVGLVFQDYALFPHLSVIDNVRLACPASRRQISAAARWKRWSRSAWAATPTISPMPCPADSSSAWRWPGAGARSGCASAGRAVLRP